MNEYKALMEGLVGVVKVYERLSTCHNDTLIVSCVSIIYLFLVVFFVTGKILIIVFFFWLHPYAKLCFTITIDL